MEDPKKKVRETYGKIAEQGSAAGSVPPLAAERAGYEADDVAAVPEGAALGLGCGNPTAIAGLKPGEVVLDLGSGGGFDAFLAAKAVGPEGRVIGVDMTPQMIERATENARKGGYENVEFRLGDIENLPVEDASVDVILSNCVINLAPDKRKVFAEAHRVLRPGGRLHVSDIVLGRPLPEDLKGDVDLYCACVAGAVPREDYFAAMAEAGFEDLTIQSERDALELLGGSCCTPDEGEQESCGCGAPDLSEFAGIAISITVSARKPI